MLSTAKGSLRVHRDTFGFETLFLNKRDSILVSECQSFRDSIFPAGMPFPSSLHLLMPLDDLFQT